MPRQSLTQNLLASQFNNDATSLLVFSPADGRYTMLSFLDSCEIPFSSTEVNDSYLLLMCGTEEELRSSNKYQNLITPRNYLLIDTQNDSLVNQFSIDKNSTSGVAIDKTQLLLYRMREGVFGNLDSINLLTGEIQTTSNIYLDNILQ
jgi:hypothetical protein